jgi:hypothetical protein
MPDRRIAKRLDRIARRLNALEEARERAPVRSEHTDAEILDVALILLAYVHRGDVESFAGYLIQDHGLPFEEAEGIAGELGLLLEDRRASAPGHPV